MSEPHKPVTTSINSVVPFVTRVNDRPKNERHMRPPSVLPIGSRLNAFETSPPNPAMANGCNLITALSGELSAPSPSK